MELLQHRADGIALGGCAAVERRMRRILLRLMATLELELKLLGRKDPLHESSPELDQPAFLET